MGSTLLFSCFFLAVSTVTVAQSVQSAQLPEEPLREKRQDPPSTCKSDDGLGTVVAQLVSELSSLKVKQHALEISQLTAKSELQSARGQETTGAGFSASTINNGQGSSFVRWGRKSCPDNTTQIYAGGAGGKQFDQRGGGTNTLCMTLTPQFDDTPIPAEVGHLYGAEYEHIPGLHDREVPCSVCLAPQSTTIMVPGTLTCPPGWTPQYTGHLASEHREHYGGEYICLDGSPEDASIQRNDNGLLLYYVVTVCGSLHCPPYVGNKVVTCAVCSQ